MARILVTGAAGFIGYHVASALAQRGDIVVGLDNYNSYYDPSLKRARVERLAGKATIHEGDLADAAAVERVFSSGAFDAVCHLGAQAGVRYSIDNPVAYETSNGMGTLNILEACRRHKAGSLVYASTSSVYGANTTLPFRETDRCDDQVSLYAATKRANELAARVYHRLYGLKVTGLRFFTVYGPWGRPDMSFFKFTRLMLEGKPIDVYNEGKMRRDFTYIDDIVKGILSAIDRRHDNEIFNLGCGRPVTLIEYIAAFEKAIGRPAVRNMMPMQAGDMVETYADISHARAGLGFEPSVPVEQGVKAFVDWYRSFYRL